MSQPCFVCGKPVEFYHFVCWCDHCLQAQGQSGLTIDEFIAEHKEVS